MKTMTLFNTVAAEVQLSYSIAMRRSDMRCIKRSQDADEILRMIWEEPMDLYESFYVLMLNKSNLVLGYRRISSGGVNGTIVDPRAVFQAALLTNASALILAHNHPSGNLTFSEADKSITEKLKKGGSLLDIAVLDHLILSTESYYSFADNGLI